MRRFVLALIVCGAATAHADPPKLEQALHDAAIAHKPLVLELYTDWCGPCHVFEERTLPDASVQSALSSVMFIRYNAEDGPGIDVASRYDVRAYPTVLAIDAQGVVRVRREGLLDPAGFTAMIGETRAALLDETTVRKQLAAAPRDAQVKLAAGKWFALHGKISDALAQLDAVAAAPNLSDAMRRDAWGAAADLRRFARDKQQLVAEKVERIRRFPSAASDDDLAIATIDSGLPRDEIRSILAIVALRQTDADALNSTAYVALAAGAYDEALYAANKMIALRHDAQHLDTLAEVHHMRGDRAKALALEDEAARLADQGLAGDLAVNRARFAAGKGEARELAQLRLRVADLWERRRASATLARQVADPDEQRQMMEKRQQAMKDMRTTVETIDKVTRGLAETCKAEARGVHEAYLRLTLDEHGHVTATTQLHEKAATDGLRRCLDGAVATVELPLPEGRSHERSLHLQFD